MAKRGKWSGAKDVRRCRACRDTVVVPAGAPATACACGGVRESLLRPLTRHGSLARDLPPPRTLREYVLGQLADYPLDTLRRRGLRNDF